MKKTLLLLSLSLLFAWPALGADAPADHDAATIDTVAMQVLDVQADSAETAVEKAKLNADVLPLSALDLALRSVERAYECPPNTAYCWTDAQCDGPCGGSSAGACTFGCCRCAF